MFSFQWATAKGYSLFLSCALPIVPVTGLGRRAKSKESQPPVASRGPPGPLDDPGAAPEAEAAGEVLPSVV